jgi:predicted RNA-binding Zn ribbon-like protein
MVSTQVSLPPPHNLQLVIDFVNTRDVEAGTDRTATPTELATWLEEHDLWDAGARETDRPPLSDAEFEQGIALREALRVVLLSHTMREADGEAGARLEEVAARGELSVRFSGGGAVQIAPRAQGYPGVLARLLVPVAHAAMDGTWARVKACVADDCHWAFYDQSRNRSGRWCDMAVCGNREKVRTYRSRRPH